MMNNTFVLGISLCENASVTLLKNGEVVSHILRERISGFKNHYGLDYNTIQICLQDANCNISEINHCAVVSASPYPALIEDQRLFIQEANLNNNNLYEDEKNAFVISNRYIHYDSSDTNYMNDISHKMKDFLDFSAFSNKKWELIEFSNLVKQKSLNYELYKEINVFLDGHKIPGFFIYHHLAHACSGFYSSNFDKALILTHDAGLDNDSGFFFEGNKNTIKPIIPHNLECLSFYKYAAQMCKIDCSDSAASKFMALSSYGKGLLDNVHSIDQINDLGKGQTGGKLLYQDIFNNLVTSKTALNYVSENTLPKYDPKEVAFAVQKQLERSIIGEIKKFVTMNSKPNFCLSGPITLNCHFNSALWREKIFNNIHIGPFCDETGLSIGAAQFVYYNILENERLLPVKLNSQSVMLGRRYIEDDILNAIGNFVDKITFQKQKNWTKIAAIDLSKNLIIGIYQGRSETGPRALGHRSILANPTVMENVERMNLIKEKKTWSPYAAIIIEEELPMWLELGPERSPFLHFIYRIKKDKKSIIPTVLHVDGTTRIQTVTKEDKDIYDLLKGFNELQKIPLVMKSSLNKPGKPMIETPLSAIEFFLNNHLDILYLNDYRIEKITPL